MATTTQCDRCRSTGHQLITLLGSELCGECVEDVRQVILTTPLRAAARTPSGKVPGSAYRRHVQAALRDKGYVCAREAGMALAVPYRTAYGALRGMAKRGEIRDAGRGRFTLAEASRGDGT